LVSLLDLKELFIYFVNIGGIQDIQGIHEETLWRKKVKGEGKGFPQI
jgi:hypothetical protein